jgi:hypothetical protein
MTIEVLTALDVNSTVFWDVKPLSLVEFTGVSKQRTASNLKESKS